MAALTVVNKIRMALVNWLSGGMITRLDAEAIEWRQRAGRWFDRLNQALFDSLVLQEKLETMQRERDTLARQLKQINEGIARVQLSNEDPASRGRIGWQVSAWFPESTLDSVRAGRPGLNEFVRLITDTLVNNAITRIFKRNPAGHCTAMVFMPDGKLGGWFEGDPSKPGITYNAQGDAAIRRIVGMDLVDAARKAIEQ